MDSLQGSLALEPVKRLSGDDSVDTAVLNRDVFGRTIKHRNIGKKLSKFCSHCRNGLNSDRAHARGDQQPGELARPCPKVNQGRCGPDRKRLEHELDSLLWVIRTTAFIRIRPLIETGGGLDLYGHVEILSVGRAKEGLNVSSGRFPAFQVTRAYPDPQRNVARKA